MAAVGVGARVPVPLPAGVVTRTMVVVRPGVGDVSVSDARSDQAVLSVAWGEVLMRFTSAEQVWTVLSAFGAVRESLRGVEGNCGGLAMSSGSDEGWGSSVAAVTWRRPPEWCVVPQSAYDERRRRTTRWVDVHMGPVLWRVVDWAGYESALTVLRNAHRTAVVVFADGGKFRADPSKMDAFTETDAKTPITPVRRPVPA